MDGSSLIQPPRAALQSYARLGGVLYLIIIVIGLLGEALIRGTLVVGGDPAATVRRIQESEWLWRLGVAAQMLLLVCAVALTWIFYVLLRPVSKNLSLLVVLFAITSLAVESVSALQLQSMLDTLAMAKYLKPDDLPQLHVMAYLTVLSHAQAFGLALIFFGVEILIVGYVIWKSGYIPKAIGVLMQLAGVCYLINSFSMVLSPALASMLFPAILLPALVGESAFCLWLLFKGVGQPAQR
ncbi:DUF4386 domain-containing protein [Pseudoduganella aquatica]|uniref:DUF4386 family protein n=1 Tax=Pseudoduganella aquatica TaxID=2660641 RepID=A0A7X4HEM3_9BURK|nr:DUF4386 domain-containing protein [Pseudoduganella aquatica]MYN09794.1 DUF4386 family protein [Pseudoduganella aquatica]